MKIILSYLILFLIFTNSHLYAAKVDPKVYVKGTECSTQYDGNCFYNLEPTAGSYIRTYYYVPVVVFETLSTVPPTAAQAYEWSVVGGVVSGQTTNQQIGVTWNNTPNYNMGTATKTIRLKITFSWEEDDVMQTKVINSILPSGDNLAHPIEVKYISTPSSITFNGSTLSNGNSLQYACGTTSQTLSVPAVTTDPWGASVTYYFYYPSGWSGPASSSTSSVTVTPHISSGGTIAIEAKRNDSNLRTKISITITRPLPSTPTLNTDDILLCNPQTITATSNGYATSFNWVTTGGISASSPGNTSSAYITGTSDGTVKVSASSSACAYTTGFSVERNVKKSAPNPMALTVYNNIGGQPDFMCRGTGIQLSAYTNEPGTSYGSWTTSDPANTYLYYSGGNAIFNTYVNNCYGIDITVSNCFGSVHKGITICVDDCGGRSANYKVFPNPASDVINVKFDETSEVANLPEIIKLYSEKGKEVKTINTTKIYSDNSFKSSRTLSIRVDDLPRGTYYLQLSNAKGEGSKSRILLE